MQRLSHRRASLLKSALLGVTALAAAQAKAVTAHTVAVDSRSPTDVRLVVEVNPAEVSAAAETWSKERYVRLEINEGIAGADRVGKPDLPVIHRLVAVDPSRVYQLEVTLAGKVTMEDVRLAPVRPDVIDDGRPAPVFFDAEAYAKDTELGSATAVIGAPVRIGGVSVLPLKITPFHYNPAKRRLTIWKRVTVRVVETAKSAERGPGRWLDQGTKLTHFQAAQVAALVANGASVLKTVRGLADPRLLILTHSSQLADARRLAAPGRFPNVLFEYRTVDGATTSTAIRDIISEEYVKGGLEAVILFGDESKIPMHQWSTYTPGDWFYTLVDGTDSYADVGLGRLPVSDAAEADIVVKKLLRYDELQRAGTVHKDVLLVAHREDYPNKYTANMERVRAAPNPRGFVYTTRYGGAGALNADVRQEINSKPYGIVLYRGHGIDSAWIGWDNASQSFDEPQVDTLANADDKMSVFLNIACDTGAIQVNYDAMAEHLMLRRDAVGASAGAVAVLGSTAPSYTEMNHVFAQYLMQAFGEEADTSLGTVIGIANNKLVRDGGGTLPENVKMYILFGDPLVQPWVR